MIKLENISKQNGQHLLFVEASAALQKGEKVGLVGPNGAGKSTLLKAIAGLVPKSSGSVCLNAIDIGALPAHRMPAAGVAFVPQSDNVFATLSVHENLRLGADRLPRSLRRLRIEQAYDGFSDLARQKRLLAGRLSGGQRQMLAIARALMGSPGVLLLDEPSAGLSPKMVSDCFAELRRVRDSGATIVLVEQNVRAALSIADRVYVLVSGRNRHEGPADQFDVADALAGLYLGIAAPAAARAGRAP